MPIAMSEKQKQYFDKIERDVSKLYEIAKKARSVGVDPSTDVECPPAMDMAGRVEQLVGPPGIGDIIREWKEEGADQDEICFRAMDWVLEGKFGERSKEEAVDLAIRVALAIKTEGVVSAPLEGIGRIVIREDKLGGDPYLSLYFAGPIRAAGGTVQAFAVLCAEHVRRKMNIAPWRPTKEEVGRFVEEVKLYDRIMNLQYPSTPEELAFAVEHLTVELNGDPTEDQEVSAHRDLPRIETNFVRGGPCLVLNDGLLLKSKKILKIIDKRKIKGWEWLKELKKLATGANKKKLEEDGKDKAKDYGGDTYKGKKIREESIEEEHTKKKELTPVEKRRKKLDEKNPPLNKFIADIIGGRPVFAYPSRVGGHRIRYGRSRNTGLAACGMHPSQMFVLEGFLAIGTQIRIERPGKSGSTMPVTSIEPPIVKLNNGDVIQLWDYNKAKEIMEKRAIDEILFLGDILFGYGEFAENNHTVIPSGYVEEWWSVELEKAIKEKTTSIKAPQYLKSHSLMDFLNNPFDNIPTGFEVIELSKEFGVGIHPRFLDHWGNVNGWELLELRAAFVDGLIGFLIKEDILSSPPADPYLFILDESIITLETLHALLTRNKPLNKEYVGLPIPYSENIKNYLEAAFVPHVLSGNSIIIDPDRAIIWIEILGLGTTSKIKQSIENYNKIANLSKELTALELFDVLTSLKVPDKAPYYMGSRMGRPEKAKERKMKPPVHILFPLGHDSKLARSFQKALGTRTIEVEICHKKCPKCGTSTFLNKCPKCGTHTEFRKICARCNKSFPLTEAKCPECGGHLTYSSKRDLPLRKYFDPITKKFNKSIPIVKGVKGMSSEFKVPEPIEKGILRAIHKIWVYKDGTIRADATDIPLTHFTCREIGVSVEKIRELGYDVDIHGEPITHPDQVIELKVQDILLTHHLAEYFVRVANFVDDELEYLYHLPRFYNVKTKEDLIGHYMAGLAPHTSAAIVGRLIGFTYAESGYAHPFWHAAKRRNCDGDEDGIMLLLDMLLNFSKYYLPSKLGGKMDAPLVLSIRLDPREVDGESHNVDYAAHYPLRFYEDSQNYPKPSKLEEYMKLYKHVLNTNGQYEGCRFTHPTESINLGPKKSAYTLFKTMEDKIESQLWLAKACRAVDARDVARKVIQSHFAPDILGNLRSFSTQGFRCASCNTKFRRIPLIGKCPVCKGKLLMTVSAGGITKYLGKAKKLIKEFDLGAYTEQRWELIERYVASLTNNPRRKQTRLSSFFK